MIIGVDASRAVRAQKTGVEWYSLQIIHALARCLSSTPHMLRLYTPSDDPVLPRDAHIEICELPWKPGRLWTQLRLSTELLRRPPQALFVPAYTMPLKCPVPAVVTIHDVAFDRLDEAYTLFDGRLHRWKTRMCVKKAQRIIVPSQWTKDELIALYHCAPDTIVVIPHGRPPDPPAINDPPDVPTPYIFVIGRIETKKNIAMMLRAFGRFRERFPHYSLALIGKTGKGGENIVRSLTTHRALHQGVYHLGWTDEATTERLLHHAQSLCFPSLYEGFGFPLVEAWAHQKPVIASCVPALREVGQDACLWVDPFDENAWTQALTMLATDPSLTHRLVERSREIRERFSWERSASQTLAVLLEAENGVYHP